MSLHASNTILGLQAFNKRISADPESINLVFISHRITLPLAKAYTRFFVAKSQWSLLVRCLEGGQGQTCLAQLVDFEAGCGAYDALQLIKYAYPRYISKYLADEVVDSLQVNELRKCSLLPAKRRSPNNSVYHARCSLQSLQHKSTCFIDYSKV